jgi:hypothetical protein
MNIITSYPVLQRTVSGSEQKSYARGDRRRERKERKNENNEFDKKVGTISNAATGLLGGIANIFKNRKQNNNTQSAPPPPPQVTHSTYVMPEQTSSKMSKGMKIGLIVGGSALVVGIIVFAIYKSRQGKGK